MKNTESSKIKKITAIEILDSRGTPTVLVKVTLESGVTATGTVPSGASTGIFEAHELRDKGDRYFGLGVKSAIENIERKIAPSLIGIPADRQGEIDRIMIDLDGTENKSNLGANAILAVSMAVARAASENIGIPLYRYLGGISANALPAPMFNIMNGGAHASNNLEIQEFMIVPENLPYNEGLRAGAEIYKTLGKILRETGLSVSVGDEGGYAPNLSCDEEALELICKAINKAGYENTVKLALDAASSEWHKNGNYKMPKSNRETTAKELIEYYKKLCEKYPIISIEDGIAEEDYEGWRVITEEMSKKIMLVGDDLFVTNKKRFDFGINLGLGNSILIKPNQIGTLTETLEVINRAKGCGYNFIISHRSGETEDSFISDLAVATNAPYIKAGAPARSERVSKYNRLLAIQQEIE